MVKRRLESTKLSPHIRKTTCSQLDASIWPKSRESLWMCRLSLTMNSFPGSTRADRLPSGCSVEERTEYVQAPLSSTRQKSEIVSPDTGCVTATGGQA